MTILVGVRCSDGVVIGADSIATSSIGQLPLIHLEADPKIQLFNNSIIVATTGAVGYTQRLHYHIEAAIKGGVFTNFTARDATTIFRIDSCQICTKAKRQLGGKKDIASVL